MRPSIDFRIETIAVATDFTSHARAALLHAMGLAHRHNSRIIVLHVIDPIAHCSPFEAPFYADGVSRIAAEEQLKELSLLLAEEGLLHETVLREGPARETILQVAEEYDADLLVLGSHGRNRIDRTVLGSVSERLMRASTCPVMVVGPETADPGQRRFHCERILFPTDLGQSSISAVAAVARFAAAHRSSLTLLHVLPPNPTQEDRVATSARLNEIIEMVKGRGTVIDASVCTGPVDDAVLSRVRDGHFSTLVLGLCDKKDFHKGTPAGLAYDLISRSPCPVFTFRKDQPVRVSAGPVPIHAQPSLASHAA